MNRIPQIILHVAGWAIFITLPILFFPGPKDVLILFQGSRGLIEIIRYALLIGYFYFNYHLLVPRYYFGKKYWQLVVLTTGMYFLIVILPGMITPAAPINPARQMSMRESPAFNNNLNSPPPPDINMPRPFDEPEILREISFRLGRQTLLFTLVFLFSLMLRINTRLRETETARQKAEVAYLHAQINPHFLFNTLNSIYSLALQKADSTAQAVVKLSNMMRYVLTDTVHERVSLAKEIEYLNNYIELQRLRLPASVNLIVTIDQPSMEEKIAPMLIIPFIENAFKYGVNPEQPSEINIEIKLEYQLLFCTIKNQKVSTGNNEKTQVGIKNVQQRLHLMYPQKHTLNIKQSEWDFTVYLSIILQ
ncbi:MAG: histidine kinase [Cyclobacteriaceae bacterium]|nr:histidine kinase [Cyclobacteriaceae bacterium]